VRPEFDGLRIDPCLPPEWRFARMIRPWRGATCEIDVERGSEPRIDVDGRTLGGTLVPFPAERVGRHRIRVTI
jgi:cellobiose phosphorylase